MVSSPGSGVVCCSSIPILAYRHRRRRGTPGSALRDAFGELEPCLLDLGALVLDGLELTLQLDDLGVVAAVLGEALVDLRLPLLELAELPFEAGQVLAGGAQLARRHAGPVV